MNLSSAALVLAFIAIKYVESLRGTNSYPVYSLPLESVHITPIVSFTYTSASLLIISLYSIVPSSF